MNTRSGIPWLLLSYSLFTMISSPGIVCAQADDSQRILSWFSKLSPTPDIQTCEFVRIDLGLKMDPTSKLVGYDFGLLLNSTDETITIWSHCLLRRTFLRNSPLGDDTLVVSATRLALPEPLANVETIYDNRKDSFGKLHKHPILSEDLLRYPILPRNRGVMVLQLFYGLKGGNIDDYLESTSVKKLEFPYREYANPSLDHLNEKSKLELVRFVASEILCEYSFRRFTDRTQNLNDIAKDLDKLLRCDLEASSHGYLLRLRESLRMELAFNTREQIGNQAGWQDIELRCVELSNLPIEYSRDGVIFDEKSKRSWRDIGQQLAKVDIERLMQSNAPTRCVFIRDSFDYDPRVLTVAELFGARKGPDQTPESNPLEVSSQGDNSQGDNR